MKKWLLYSLFALFLVCGIDLGKKYILDLKLIDPDSLVIYTTILVGFLGLIHLFLNKKCKKISSCNFKTLMYLFIVSCFIYGFSVVFTRSMDLASDVTFPIIIISLSSVIIYLVSSIFFAKSPDFDPRILFGIAITVLGLGIVSYYMKD
jgi:uncharacterized membrane protein